MICGRLTEKRYIISVLFDIITQKEIICNAVYNKLRNAGKTVAKGFVYSVNPPFPSGIKMVMGISPSTPLLSCT